MLQLFRSNQFFTVFLILIYAFLLRWHLFIEPAGLPKENIGVASSWVYAWLAEKTTAQSILAILLLTLQAVLLNYLFNSYRMNKDNTFIPAVAYLLVSSASVEFASLSPVLMANTFLLIAWIELFDAHRKIELSNTIFNIGFFIGIAGLFYFSMLYYFLVAIIGLSILRTFSWRETLVLLIGVIVPFFLVGVYYFWIDKLNIYWTKYIILNFNIFNWKISFKDYYALISLTIIGFLFVWTLLNTGSLLRKASVLTGKYVSILLIGVFLLAVSFLCQYSLFLNHFLMIAPSLAIFFAMQLLTTESKVSAEFLHLVTLMTMLALQYHQLIF